MLTLFATKKTKAHKSHIMNLVQLAKADGKISKSESGLLIKIGERNGVSAEEVFEMVDSSDDFFYKKPTNDEQRFDQLYDLVEMMRIDGEVSPKELTYTTEIAEKMGVRKAVAWILVQSLVDGMALDLSKEELKARAAEYLFI
ncbi:TerB family tellurite resistance protein [Cytophaga aurantiaca]|uniref:tellurite resistance TerB family protein n=1 Tax=Cytophaga aurantiaca TaxID=29530 RepID=UPI00037C96E1|nr:TerB family tellurite resistance protein [Cytophaga aurantiaca]